MTLASSSSRASAFASSRRWARAARRSRSPPPRCSIGLAAFWLGDARWISEPAAPAIAWVIVLLAIGAPLAWTIVHVRRAATPAKVAHAIERERALRDGSLRGALEVEGQGAFGKRAAAALGSSLASHRGALAPLMLRGALVTGAGAAVCALLALVLLGGARRNAPDGWRAMRHPVGAWTGALVPPLSIVEPPREVMRGDSLRLRILAPSRRTIEFHTRATGAPWSARTLDVSDGAAAVTLGPLDADVALVATDGRTHTDTVVVRVTDRPFVGDVAIRAIYPSYLDRPAETVPAGETVRVPRGTTLVIRGRASAALDAVALVSAHDTVKLAPDGHNFSGRLNASSGGRWMWMARGERGPVADVPAPLDVDVLPDSAPRVEIVDPAHDTVALAGNELALRAAASDDHGLATVTMRSWREMASGARAAGRRAAARGAERARVVGGGDDRRGRARAAAGRRAARDDRRHRQLAVAADHGEQGARAARALAHASSASSRVRWATASRRAPRARRPKQKQLAQRTDEAAKSRDRTSTTSEGKSSGKSGSNSESEKSRNVVSRGRAVEGARGAAAEAAGAGEVAAEGRAGARRSSCSPPVRSTARCRASSRRRSRCSRRRSRPSCSSSSRTCSRARASSRRKMRDRSMENLAKAQQALKQQLERSAEMLKRAALEGSMQTLRDEAKDLAKQERATAEKMARADSGAGRDAAPLSDRSHQLASDVQQLATTAAAGKGGERSQGAAAGRAARAAVRGRDETGGRDEQRAERASSRERTGRRIQPPSSSKRHPTALSWPREQSNSRKRTAEERRATPAGAGRPAVGAARPRPRRRARSRWSRRPSSSRMRASSRSRSGRTGSPASSTSRFRRRFSSRASSRRSRSRRARADRRRSRAIRARCSRESRR